MAKKIIAETKKEVKEWIEGGRKRPASSVIGCGSKENNYTKSVVKACKEIGVPTSGKNIAVCGRSQKIGLPIATLACLEDTGEMSSMNATVTICHTTTPKEQLSYLVKKADVLISACGVPGLIEAPMLKEGTCVIDVGSVVIEDEKTQKMKLVGDLNFEEMKKVASFITPVPGGMGPVAIAMTMRNILTLSKKMVQYDIFEPGAALYLALVQHSS